MTTIIDPPAVTIGNASAAESDGEIVFEVELSAASIRQITVDYRTEDGTATAPEDYGTASGSLTFAAGQTSGSISIRVVDDALDEADRETFTVRLSAPKMPGSTGTPVSATGTIIDDDDPPAISIADASAKESAGEIAFRVSLDAPSGREVAVSYRTEDGTAKAGEDYGATDGTLTIAAGRTDATIRVALMNDILEEEEETFTVRLLDPVNAELADPTAIGTIIDDDVSVAQVWLARFGRTVATHVVDAVGERLNEAAGRSSEAAIAGHPLQPAPIPAEWQESTPIPFRTLAGHELVAGSSFRLASSGDEDEAADGGSKWTGWGRGAVTRLAGKEPKADLLLRGTIATGTAGVDYDWGGVLTGLAMAYTGGGGNFKTDEPYLEPRSGTAESWLLSAHPYARVSVVDGLEVWGLLGYGLGMMTLTEDASVNTDIRMMMGAAGVRGILLTPMANGGFGVAVSSDGFAMRANADAAGHQPAVEADAVRGRLLVEGSYDAQLGDGSVLTPIVEAGMRYDAGHAEEGFGAELGGGVRYVKPEWGLTATANGRFVLAHQDRGFQEWGLRGSLQWSPGAGGPGAVAGREHLRGHRRERRTAALVTGRHANPGGAGVRRSGRPARRPTRLRHERRPPRHECAADAVRRIDAGRRRNPGLPRRRTRQPGLVVQPEPRRPAPREQRERARARHHAERLAALVAVAAATAPGWRRALPRRHRTWRTSLQATPLHAQPLFPGGCALTGVPGSDRQRPYPKELNCIERNQRN